MPRTWPRHCVMPWGNSPIFNPWICLITSTRCKPHNWQSSAPSWPKNLPAMPTPTTRAPKEPGMSKEKSTLTLAAALNAALADEMSANDMVVVFGEDVGTLGGVFRITEGLSQQFGDDRCFDTPLAESGIAGTAIGMAIGGVRPV